MRTARFLLGCLLTGCVAEAKDLSALYSDADLRERGARYEPNLRWNFENVVLGNLTEREQAQLGKVTLHVPLHAAPPLRGDPFAYYCDTRAKVVTIPVMSLKFLDDLSIAWSYAEARRLDTSALMDYVAVLKYRDPGSFSGFRPPLEALGIPADVIPRDKAVDEDAQKIFKSAVVWLMAHEVGHVLHRHPGYGSGLSMADLQRNESQADEFATEILRRVRVAPLGLAFFFSSVTAWTKTRADFPSHAEWQRHLSETATHPLDGQRLRAIGAAIESQADRLGAPSLSRSAAEPAAFRAVGRVVASLGELLDDPDIHTVLIARALAADPVGLRLRPAGMLVSQLRPRWPDVGSDRHLCGLYTGTYRHQVQGGRVEELEGAMLLECKGQAAQGRFGFGMGEGTLTGVIRSDVLAYEWRWGDAHGRGELAVQPSGHVRGEWGYVRETTGGGSWRLQRPQTRR